MLDAEFVASAEKAGRRQFIFLSKEHGMALKVLK